MTDVQLNLPGSKERYPPKNHVLATFHALPKDNNDRNLRYTLANNRRKYLQIYPTTGDIMFGSNGK